MATLRLGDAIANGGNAGVPVRFAGVQWATNFATRPGFVTMPQPGIAGEATLPSTVDLYINDALRWRGDVSPGPFSLQHLPIMSGDGTARLVVRDVLGREQVVVQPFSASARLLRPGLEEFAYEVGTVRRNYGLASADYGALFAAATTRRGWLPELTGELHAEASAGRAMAAVAADLLVPRLGAFTSSLAASHADGRAGGQVALGYEIRSHLVSAGGSARLASPAFRAVGLSDSTASRRTVHAFASLALPWRASVFASYVDRLDFAGRADRLASLGASLPLQDIGFLSASVVVPLEGARDVLAAISLTYPLDARTSATASVQRDTSRSDAEVVVQRNLPAGRGSGYRVIAGTSPAQRLSAEGIVQTDTGIYTATVARSAGDTAIRVGAAGGVAFLGGRLYAARPLADSFGVLALPGFANVRVYADNQLVARTDASGAALLPHLRPWETNRIRFELADLPMDAMFDTTDLLAVPRYRSGVLLVPAVRRVRSVTATVVLENGAPLPAGSLAHAERAGPDFPAGVNGVLFLSDVTTGETLTVNLAGGPCRFTLQLPGGDDPLPDLGVVVCRRAAS
jgi:outer membrane usher protein